MATNGVYASDLSIGDMVRLETQIWRVARVDRCGSDEVEVIFVSPIRAEYQRWANDSPASTTASPAITSAISMTTRSVPCR